MRYGLIENRLREEVSQLKGQAEQAHSQVQTLLASRHAENREQLQLMMDEAGKKIKQLNGKMRNSSVTIMRHPVWRNPSPVLNRP